jgi:RNA polymerase sigma-70 factor, ECF subfamily
MSDPVQPETDDFILMARLREDDERAFRLLMDRHQRPIMNFFMRMGASTCSEDLAQETFIRLWKYRFKYKPVAKFTTFIYTLARHVWLDYLRRKIRFQEFSERYQEEMPGTSDGGMEKLRRRLDIQAALDGLSPKLREVLILAVYQGLSYQEIADVLSIPLGTVKSRVFNALTRVKEKFNET